MSRDASPLVSMLIPSFNHGAYVRECIDAVIDQDYANIELIIIDDGSTDDSRSRIEGMVEVCATRFERFEFRARPNQGLSETINEALAWSRGKYFAAIASDDVLFPNKTSTLVGHLEEEQGVAGVFGGCEFIDDTGFVIKELMPQAACYVFDNILSREYSIVGPCQLMRLDALREVGGYPVGLYIEDWYMWLALTDRGYKLKVISDVLVKYRRHGTNISNDALKMYEARKSILTRYSNRAGFARSMAQVCTMAAIDFSRVSKVASCRFLHEATSHSHGIVFTRIFWSGFARILAPTPVLNFLRGLRVYFGRYRTV